MPPAPFICQPVGAGAWLDSGLALVHPDESWLAVADLHYGYEVCQRAAGGLFPLWGMEELESRLDRLIQHYRPTRLILAGDLLHASAAIRPLIDWLNRLRADGLELILIEGNHDRHLAKHLALVDEWTSGPWRFVHGHGCDDFSWPGTTIQGHWHPAWTLRDGAGTRLRLPAFVQRENQWILPAFSPWAAGTAWAARESDAITVCHPSRLLTVNPLARAAGTANSRLRPASNNPQKSGATLADEGSNANRPDPDLPSRTTAARRAGPGC